MKVKKNSIRYFLRGFRDYKIILANWQTEGNRQEEKRKKELEIEIKILNKLIDSL